MVSRNYCWYNFSSTTPFRFKLHNYLFKSPARTNTSWLDKPQRGSPMPLSVKKGISADILQVHCHAYKMKSTIFCRPNQGAAIPDEHWFFELEKQSHSYEYLNKSIYPQYLVNTAKLSSIEQHDQIKQNWIQQVSNDTRKLHIVISQSYSSSRFTLCHQCAGSGRFAAHKRNKNNQHPSFI